MKFHFVSRIDFEFDISYFVFLSMLELSLDLNLYGFSFQIRGYKF